MAVIIPEMKSPTKKICLLFFGDYCAQDQMNIWLNNVPELRVMGKIEPIFVLGQNTADAVAADWLDLAKTIANLSDKYDGFVVLHNLENLLFTAAAISFLLPRLSRPIVFTGALNAQAKDSGIKSNIINACQLASYALAEVCLLFGNKILRASQASRNFSSSLNLFQAPASGALGQIDFSIRLFSQARKSSAASMKLVGGLEDDILSLEANPTLSPSWLLAAAKGKKAIFIRADANPLSAQLLKTLQNLAVKTPVAVFGWDPADKNSGQLITVNKMTVETGLVKLMWALKQTNDADKIKQLLNKDLAGEIIL